MTVLAGGLAGWAGELETGVVEVDKTRAELVPHPGAVAGLWDVVDGTRSDARCCSTFAATDEFTGKGGYPCDPRQGHIPGARNVEVSTLFAAPGVPKPAEDVPRPRRRRRGRVSSSPTATRARARGSR